MKKVMIYIVGFLFVLYVLVCLFLYFFQERFIFFPEKLAKDYRFHFQQNFSEVYFPSKDNTELHGLLFKADSPKGVIFYLHGNAGSLHYWGEAASFYTNLQYDIFMFDYRGYGKSEGKIKSEADVYQDAQAAYEVLKKSYAEQEIVVLGYSLGSGPATKIAATNHPRLLILLAPYYSIQDVMKHHYPIIPTFLLKYRFETYTMIRKCTMPVTLFHGNRDEVIPYQSALKLKALLQDKDNFVTLEGGGHNGMSDHPVFETEIRKALQPAM